MLKIRLLSFTTLLCVLTISVSSFATETKLPPELEARARHLFTELRCVVCQNQSIDSSEADVAKDLRQIVREQISAGNTDGDIRSYLVARYGEFILLKPRLSWHSFLLWGTPLFVLLIGGVLIFARFRRGDADSLSEIEEELSDAEKADLAEILDRTKSQ